MSVCIYMYNASIGFTAFWQIGSTELKSNREQIVMSCAGLICIPPFLLGSRVHQHSWCLIRSLLSI